MHIFCWGLCIDDRKYEQALEAFLQCKKEQPENQDLLMSIVKTLQALGQKEKALETVEELITLQGNRASKDDLDSLTASLSLYEKIIESFAFENKEAWERNLEKLENLRFNSSYEKGSEIEEDSLLLLDIPEDEVPIIDIGSMEPVFDILEEEEQLTIEEEEEAEEEDEEEELPPVVPYLSSLAEPEQEYEAPKPTPEQPLSEQGKRHDGNLGEHTGGQHLPEQQKPSPSPELPHIPRQPVQQASFIPSPPQTIRIQADVRTYPMPPLPPASESREEIPSQPPLEKDAFSQKKPPEGSPILEKKKEKDIADLFSYLSGLTNYLPEEKKHQFLESDTRLKLESLKSRFSGRPGLVKDILEHYTTEKKAEVKITPERVEDTLEFIGGLSIYHPDTNLGTMLKNKVSQILEKLNSIKKRKDHGDGQKP